MTSGGSSISFGSAWAVPTRFALLALVALATTACANEPLAGGTPHFAEPMRLLNSGALAAEAPVAPSAGTSGDDMPHKSLAAKVLAGRALETVTGLKTDPARLSEHD